MVNRPQPGEEAYARGAAAAEQFAAMLPPGAHFVLLVALPEDDGAHVACMSNIQAHTELVRAWLRMLDEDNAQSGDVTPTLTG